MTKNQLKQRVNDVYSGAVGGLWNDYDDFAGANELSRILPALKGIFDPDEKHKYLFYPSALYHYETVEAATEFLWAILFKYPEE